MPPTDDDLLARITDYVLAPLPASDLAQRTAHLCLIDSLACALEALRFPACTRLLGPMVPGVCIERGARVPGTLHELDPVKAAFDIGCCIRWLDFSDAWFGAEGAHPSDNLGAILALADWLDRNGPEPVHVEDVLGWLVKAYEIQGLLSMHNSFVKVGLDHVGLVRIASAAVAAAMLGGDRGQVISAVSNAFLDGFTPRTYRIPPNMGSRKSWAAADATSRGVFLALLAMRGEMGYPGALAAPRWGFQDVVFHGRALVVDRPFGTHIVENILFKIPYPAQFHAQSASECARRLRPFVQGREETIERVRVRTHRRTLDTIDKPGPLANAADRDHCLQYVVAVVLLKGALSAADYEDEAAADPRIDRLRGRIEVVEDPAYSAAFDDPARRANPNAIEIVLADGSTSGEVEVFYPLGHPRRRDEALPVIREKFRAALAGTYAEPHACHLEALCGDHQDLKRRRTHELMDAFRPER